MRISRILTGAAVMTALLLGTVGCTEDDNSTTSNPTQAQPNEVLPDLQNGIGSRADLCQMVEGFGQYTPKAGGAQPGTSTGVLTKPVRTEDTKSRGPAHLRNSVDDNVLSIFYTLNSDTLYDNDLRDLRQYIRALDTDNLSSLVIEGYAGPIGSDADNEVLARKRAESVKKYVRTYLPRSVRDNVDITVVSLGESKLPPGVEDSPDTKRQRRRARIIPERNVIQIGLDELPARNYLLDQSGSMKDPVNSEMTKWEAIQAYQFPDNSKVWSFSGNRSRPCTGDLSQEGPDGGTPLFESLYKVVSESQNTSITVLTDGQADNNNYVGDVIREAKARNVRINFLGLGLSGSYRDTLDRIASATGGQGKYYSQ
jgi:outer membrane protein OmpA-like peptidoglycan-associated protein